ncbi:hypothetical protein [Aquimarina hainanensis]|uniref:hypothetical protein n=1 Tax=Aquimarina hainanensis TaxID=1578017 RepID=UPI00361B7C07
MKTSHRTRQAFFAVVATITLSSCEQEASTAETANVSPPEHMISLDKATTEYNNFYTTRIAPVKPPLKKTEVYGLISGNYVSI